MSMKLIFIFLNFIVAKDLPVKPETDKNFVSVKEIANNRPNFGKVKDFSVSITPAVPEKSSKKKDSRDPNSDMYEPESEMMVESVEFKNDRQ